ncbi:MAG: PEGA domain-containing protein [Pirellulaceae bacterium]|nr:PEGA domain-containing protein [Pirellulaceae bacterium]
MTRLTVNSCSPGLSRQVLIALLAAACLASAGCVRRRMTVRSFPQGAQVFVDDQEIGTTPCSAAFVYYGTRKITLIKDGYRTETLYQAMNPPWYQIPPLDFVTENLLSREIRDERVVDVQLVPQEIVPQAKLLERAQSLRGGAVTGQITLPPGVDAPPILSRPGDGLPGGEPIPRYPLPAPPGVIPGGQSPVGPAPIEAVPAPAPLPALGPPPGPSGEALPFFPPAASVP